MIDNKALEIARQASQVAELADAQALGHLADASRLNRAMIRLRAQMSDYIGHSDQD